MIEEKQVDQGETLGEFLYRQRKDKKLEIDEIASNTKIPAKTLRAMEADDYTVLPPDAFARGFYTLYANFLGLDSDELIVRYEKERGLTPDPLATPPPQQSGVSSLAAKPYLPDGSFLGMSVVLIVIAIGLLCWHFSWNPATFLSEKLRSLQNNGIEGTLSSTDDPSVSPDVNSQYLLTALFHEETTVTVQLDNNQPIREIFVKGSSHSWYANEAISLILPDSAQVSLKFNNSAVPLPQPKSGLITLNLP